MENTREFLRSNPDILVSNSDKGSVTILSSRVDYTQKMQDLINDAQMFRRIDSDPTKSCQNRNNSLVDEWFGKKCTKNQQRKVLSKEEKYERLKYITKISISPRVYGVIKYHKEGLPIRPIVSTINSPSYAMSRMLATTIKKSFIPKYNVKNSQTFIKQLRRTYISENNVLVSFDVVNCFGNIPTDVAIALLKRDFEKIRPNTDIPEDLFFKMLNFCLNEANYFSFENKHYRQLLGMFMGSSLAPVLVERVIEEAVDNALSMLDFVPDFWKIYVDDHLTSVPENKIDLVLNALNSFNPTVKFTVEIQDMERKSINFLDVNVINDNGRVKTNWYHKPIASNRLLNFYSAHPKQMIHNTARSFVRRVHTLSHRSFHQQNTVVIRSILERNNFPAKVIDHMLQQVRSNMRVTENVSYPFINSTVNNQDVLNEEPKQFCGMTFVPDISEPVMRIMRQAIPNLVIAPRPPLKASVLFANRKDKIALNEQSGMVYKINCNECDQCYIGETTQKLGTRISQHQTNVRGATLMKNPTALVRHVLVKNHSFDFQGAVSLRRERNKRKLQLQEINQIIIHRDSVCNFKTDSEDVSPLYYNLVKFSNAPQLLPENISIESHVNQT